MTEHMERDHDLARPRVSGVFPGLPVDFEERLDVTDRDRHQ